MLIAPIVFCTVVLGIAKMGDMSKVGKVAIKALIYFEVMTTVALALALVIVIVNLWQPGAGMNVNTGALDAGSVEVYVDQTRSHGTVSFLMTVGTIPVTSVALVLGVHRLLAEGLVPTNLIGNAVATIVVSKWENGLDQKRLQAVLADRSAVPLAFGTSQRASIAED